VKERAGNGVDVKEIFSGSVRRNQKQGNKNKMRRVSKWSFPFLSLSDVSLAGFFLDAYQVQKRFFVCSCSEVAPFPISKSDKFVTKCE
jgi:hypothetical protein